AASSPSAVAAPPPVAAPDGGPRQERTTVEIPEADPTPEDDDRVLQARRYLEEVPPSKYLEIKGEQQLRDATWASRMWQTYYAVGAGPYAPEHSARHFFYIGGAPVVLREHFPERFALRHQYEVGGIELSILENKDQSLVSVEVPRRTPDAQAKVAQRIAATLFEGGAAPLHFSYHESKDEVARFHSDSIALPEESRGVTIHGSITQTRIYFLLEQAPARSGGFGRGHGSVFPASLRNAWDARPKRP
ncbi:MAG: hypothetical protein ACMG6S_23590, partial [Byssovorax sp.]